MDLATFWAGLAAAAAAGEMERLRVVELGCGHGLPGVVALLAGSSVHFQDYNKEVLQVLTVPTVAANWAAHCARGGAAPLPAPAPRARYFSGDWSSYAQLLDALDLQGTYDVVLSAETIYNLAGMRSLYLCIKQASPRLLRAGALAAQSSSLITARSH
jgi:predicted nicotinamide N-methyase